MRPHHLLLGFACSLGLAAPLHAATVEWNAAGATPPDSVCPAWTRGTNGGGATFVDGALRIATSGCSQNLFFMQSDTSIAIPDTLVLEARLAVDEGFECVGPCGHYRQVAALSVTTAPNVGSLCFVAPGAVLLATTPCGAALTASVPTSGMHTYRVVIRNGTSVSVYQDGTPLLSGSTFTSAPDHGPAPRVLWGDGSSLAYGTTRWEFVRHNAHADGCATTSVGATPAAPRSDGIVASPNPARTRTTLRFRAPRPGAIAVVLYDVSGRRVRELASDGAEAGERVLSWDGTDSAGRRVRPGAYFARVAGDSRSRACLVLRTD
ncbi:MAG: FlgD immunoglobulin-like domain containing protein [Candidatus Eisenbacteria bacterium]